MEEMIVTKDDFICFCSYKNSPRTNPDYSSDCDFQVKNPGDFCEKHNGIMLFIKQFNKERKGNKNKWVQIFDSIGGVEIKTKSYNTWIQLMYVNGVKRSGPMDCSVKEMNKFLEETLNDCLK